MSLIINTPFECPAQHWVEGKGGKLEIKPERRPASYEVFDARNNTKRTEVLDIVNTIRARVDQWREDGWPGVTIVTRKLLEHWHDREARQHPFYFCQLEAIETLIWWVEGAEAYKQGIAIPGDGGAWERLCNKMATGAGKTTVMAMIITWQVLNALTYPKRNKDFSRAVFIVAPGLTVKERLQVLLPSEGSYYDEFNLCPSEALRSRLNQAEVLIENWHSLMPLKEADRSVVKKGRESDEAFTRRVLGKLAAHKDIIVINDEAHHAYRKPPEVRSARRWPPSRVSTWTRRHADRRLGPHPQDPAHPALLRPSATPSRRPARPAPTRLRSTWIVFGFRPQRRDRGRAGENLRVVVRDDAVPGREDPLRSKLYHIYRDPSVSEDEPGKSRTPRSAAEAGPGRLHAARRRLAGNPARWREAGHHRRPSCSRSATARKLRPASRTTSTRAMRIGPNCHAPTKTAGSIPGS